MRPVATVLIVTLLSIASPVYGQPPGTGSIHGIVRDQQGGVMPGVAIAATSPDAPLVYRATTDAAGRYRLIDLPPGTYEVVAELQGFARFVRPEVVIRAGLNLPVDMTMKVGDVGETVEVRVETPLLETKHGTQAANISGDLLRSVPLAEQRGWSAALAITPGVVTTSFGRPQLFYVRGSEETATVLLLDGIDVTDAQRIGVMYLQLSTDAIEDIQIQTAAISASAPLGNGGVINIVTASGTNQPKGSAGVFLQPQQWNDSNQPGGTSTRTDQLQIDLSFGGPIVRDRVWGFGAYRRSDITTGVSRTAAQIEVLRALISGYEPQDSTNESNYAFVKLTAQASAAHQIVGFYQRDVNPVFRILPQGQHPFGQATGGSAGSVRVSSLWSDRLTSRLGVSYNDKHRESIETGIDGPMMRVYNGTIRSAGRLLGNGQLATLGAGDDTRLSEPNNKLTIAFDTTLYARQGSGAHELQFGVYTQRKLQGRHLTYINDGLAIEDLVLRRAGVYDSGLIPFHRMVIGGTELTALRQRTGDYAAYLQDAWRPSARLTLNAGVRVDGIVVDDEVFGITAQRSLEIGPRVGANYVITADSRNVARAYWARVHDQPSIATSTGNPRLGQQDLYDLDLDGTFETVFVTPSSAGAVANRAIDPDLHQPWVQEWGVGFSRQFTGGVAANVDFVHRRFVHRATLVETNGRYEGRVFTGFADENVNDFFVTTNNKWNTPVYSSLEFSVTKRTARVQALASYVRQWRHMDGTWQPNDPASFIQPDAFPNNRGIGSSTGTSTATFDANSLSGFHMTQPVTASAQWQDHVARATLSYTGPWGLLLSTNYAFQSGAWSGPIITRIAAPDPAFGPTTVRLSNGRVVSNPLATTFRFAYPTRGEGQLRTPHLHAWNVRIGKRFTLKRVRLDAAIDVFNVTNHDADLGHQFLANQTFNPFFGATVDRQLPRSAQLVLRASF